MLKLLREVDLQYYIYDQNQLKESISSTNISLEANRKSNYHALYDLQIQKSLYILNLLLSHGAL